MTDEGEPTRLLLSRREVVTLLGATGVAWLMAGSLNPGRAAAVRLARPVWSDQNKPKVPISSTSA